MGASVIDFLILEDATVLAPDVQYTAALLIAFFGLCWRATLTIGEIKQPDANSSDYGFCKSSGSLAIFTAMRRALSCRAWTIRHLPVGG